MWVCCVCTFQEYTEPVPIYGVVPTVVSVHICVCVCMCVRTCVCVCACVCIAVASLLSKAERSQLNEDDDSVYQELVESHDDIQPEKTASYNNINPNSKSEVGKVGPSWCGEGGKCFHTVLHHTFMFIHVMCNHSSCQTHCLACSLKVLMLALCPGLLSSDDGEALLLQWHET